MTIMQCCKCSKDIDVDDKESPAKWFGLYMGWRPLKVICAPCAKKEGNKDWWIEKS